MDASKFTENILGTLIPTTTARGADVAFVPFTLPESWEPTAKVWRHLVEAHKVIGRLDGVGRHMPDHRILLRPLQQREAIRSSSLEGTYATPEDLLREHRKMTQAELAEKVSITSAYLSLLGRRQYPRSPGSPNNIPNQGCEARDRPARLLPARRTWLTPRVARVIQNTC